MQQPRRRRFNRTYTVRLEHGQAKEFDAMLSKKGLSRSALLRTLIADALACS